MGVHRRAFIFKMSAGDSWVPGACQDGMQEGRMPEALILVGEADKQETIKT